MKILLLTQYFPPEFGAAAARNSEHARLWAEAGHEVEVCTGMPNYPEGVVRAPYRGKCYVREEGEGYTIHRAWIHAAPNRSVLQRGLASLSFLVSAFLCGAFRCARPDVVIASSGPFFVGPLGWLLSVVKQAPFVFEVRDLLPQQAVDIGMIRNRALIALLTAVESFLYRRAAAIVTVAPASREALIARGFAGGNIHTIENGVREDFFTPAPPDEALRAELGWEGRHVALYVGAHGVSQGLGALLDAADALRDCPDVLIVLAGGGAEKPRLMEAAAERGLDNVQFLPLQEKVRMPHLYASADACFVPLRRGRYFTINIPSKLFEIMACGRPVILAAEGQARAVLEAAKAGIAVPPEDGAACAEALRRLRANPEEAAAFGARGRTYVTEQFTRARKANQYLDLLRKVVEDA